VGAGASTTSGVTVALAMGNSPYNKTATSLV